MAYAFPGGAIGNTFVPSHEASGSLITGFSRNPKKFRLPQYVKYIPVKQSAGYYMTINNEEGARIVNTNLNDFYWGDGSEAPMGNDNLESFTFNKFYTKRYAFPFNIGNKATEQASWEVTAVNAGFMGMKAMTARTQFAWNVLGTTGNWSSNTDTATNTAGGLLDAATTANPYIKKLFRAVSENILKATNGVVQRDDLICVMNPHTAGLISESQELIDHFKNNQFALAQVRGDAPNQNGQWGLPDQLYGVKVLVEDAVKVTTRKGATRSASYVCPATDIVFLARPGQLQGMEGIPEFSTAQFFFYEEFTVEQKEDPDNRRTLGRVIDDYDFQLCQPLSGWLTTAATAT